MELRTDWVAAGIGTAGNFDALFSPMLSPQERARLFTESGVKAVESVDTGFLVGE